MTTIADGLTAEETKCLEQALMRVAQVFTEVAHSTGAEIVSVTVRPSEREDLSTLRYETSVEQKEGENAFVFSFTPEASS